MKQSTISQFFRNNGFKLALALIVFTLVLFKDLNFQVNLRAPELGRSAQAVPRAATAAQPAGSLSAEEPLAAVETDTYDRFDMNPFRGSPEPAASSTPARLEEDKPSFSETDRSAFVKRFAHVAVSEKAKYGVPASLILGNALLISRAGKTDLSQRANNFFALPCTAGWRGQRHTRSSSCFRAYENAWTSFRDNSVYLREGKFAALGNLENDDYRGWAKALEQAGYYPPGITSNQVIGEIERFKLYLHDR